MRMRLFLSSLFAFTCFIQGAEGSYSISNDTAFLNEAKLSSIIESKPTTSPYTKLAKVQFLTDTSKLEFGGGLSVAERCAALGYPLHVSKCESQETPGIVSSRLCSEVVEGDGADQYTSGCCNTRVYTVENRESCTNNSMASPTDFCYYNGAKHYRCTCDRSRFPYSNKTGEGCGTSATFDFTNIGKCMAPDNSGEMTTYYMGCCPNDYKECDGGDHVNGYQRGVGAGCMKSEDATQRSYEMCECPSSFDTPWADCLIRKDSNLVCKDSNNKRWTKSSNCETGCDSARETNIDQSWDKTTLQCLYSEDGRRLTADRWAQCKKGEDLPAFYDYCENQGYKYVESDCVDSDSIARCPYDDKKVFCVDATYCGRYPVSGAACTLDGVDVEICPQSPTLEEGQTPGANYRCKYRETECNACWKEGHFVGGCPDDVESETTTEFEGNGLLLENGKRRYCCKKGYRFWQGTCVPVSCNRNEYPYAGNPTFKASELDDIQLQMGEIEFCYQADPNGEDVDSYGEKLGYKPYFGYAKCYGHTGQTEEEGDSFDRSGWVADESNPRKCLCDREDKYNLGRAYLPYEQQHFDKTAGTYKQLGYYFAFNQGQSAANISATSNDFASCEDESGKYYGYRLCRYTYTSFDDTNTEHRGRCGKYTTHSTSHPLMGSYGYTYRSTKDNTNSDYDVYVTENRAFTYIYELMADVLGDQINDVPLNEGTKGNKLTVLVKPDDSATPLPTLRSTSVVFSSTTAYSTPMVCINQRDHCDGGQDTGGNPETDSVCNIETGLVVSPWSHRPCEDGASENCTICYHVANIVKTGNTYESGKPKYAAHGKFKLTQAAWNGGNGLGFEECPEGYFGGYGSSEGTLDEKLKDGAGWCGKYCSYDEKNCRLGDILYVDDPDLGTDSIVGIVVYSDDEKYYVAAVFKKEFPHMAGSQGNDSLPNTSATSNLNFEIVDPSDPSNLPMYALSKYEPPCAADRCFMFSAGHWKLPEFDNGNGGEIYQKEASGTYYLISPGVSDEKAVDTAYKELIRRGLFNESDYYKRWSAGHLTLDREATKAECLGRLVFKYADTYQNKPELKDFKYTLPDPAVHSSSSSGFKVIPIAVVMRSDNEVVSKPNNSPFIECSGN